VPVRIRLYGEHYFGEKGSRDVFAGAYN